MYGVPPRISTTYAVGGIQDTSPVCIANYMPDFGVEPVREKSPLCPVKVKAN